MGKAGRLETACPHPKIVHWWCLHCINSLLLIDTALKPRRLTLAGFFSSRVAVILALGRGQLSRMVGDGVLREGSS
jgi:hypothetical protein